MTQLNNGILKEPKKKQVFAIWMPIIDNSIPFQVSIVFFHENGNALPPNGDIVYPITKEKDTIFETAAHYHLKKLTEYYDTETREFKRQTKIIFVIKNH